MPLRVPDPTLWSNLPGVVAAYQPIGAPDGLTARQNMALGGRGRYAAVPGAAPAWATMTGWAFAGAEYLTTDVIPTDSYSMLILVAGVTNDGVAIGEYVPDARFELSPRPGFGTVYGHGGAVVTGSGFTAGSLAVSNHQGHKDGQADGSTIGAWTGGAALPLYIGDRNGASSPFAGNVLAAAIYDRKLTATEIWLAKFQTQYCHVNAAWSVWTPQRRWFFVPSATPSGTTMFPGTAATSAATAPYDDDDWTTPDNAKANDGSYAYIDPFAAASSGPSYPNGTLTTVNTTAPYGDLDWDDKAGVGADDTDYASITSGSFDANVISYLGKAQQYGFAVPARAVITGVEVVVAKSRSAGTSCVDSCVQLLGGNGALFGDNKADGTTNWPASITGITYGGAGDMWGLNTSTLTPAIVNDADFGVGIAVKSTANNVDANVDYITIKVYYNEPTFDANDYSYLLKLSNFGFSIPAGVTVTGVKVTVERKAVGTIKDAIVKLLDGDGALQGNDKADTGTAWPASDTATDYGGEGDTWGATVTPTVINDTDFGVAIAVKADAVDSAPYIDYVSMTVYYSAGNTYNLTAVAAGVATTTTPDLARTMSMATAAAAVGLTPSADLARIIAQAASADAATATGTPTLQSMIMMAAAATATGATSTADLLKLIGLAGGVNGTTVTSTADLARIIGQQAAANGVAATGVADLARIIAKAAVAAGNTATSTADLGAILTFAAQVLATGATASGDLARIIGYAVAANAVSSTAQADLTRAFAFQAAANAVGTTSTADLAKLIAQAAAANGVTLTSDAAITVATLISLAALAAAATATSTADLARIITHTVVASGATATSTADLTRIIVQAAAVVAQSATSTADLLKLVGLAGSANGVTVTGTPDLLRLVGLVAAANAASVTSTADLARIIDMVSTVAGLSTVSLAELIVSGGLLHFVAAIAAITSTPAADLARQMPIAALAQAATVTPAVDLARLLTMVGAVGAQGNTSTADLLRLIGLAASVNGLSLTPAADLLKQINLTGSSAGMTVTPDADLLKLIGLAVQADAVTTVSLAELLVAGLMEIYRRRIPDAVRVGSRGVE